MEKVHDVILCIYIYARAKTPLRLFVGRKVFCTKKNKNKMRKENSEKVTRYMLCI